MMGVAPDVETVDVSDEERTRALYVNVGWVAWRVVNTDPCMSCRKSGQVRYFAEDLSLPPMYPVIPSINTFFDMSAVV